MSEHGQLGATAQRTMRPPALPATEAQIQTFMPMLIDLDQRIRSVKSALASYDPARLDDWYKGFIKMGRDWESLKNGRPIRDVRPLPTNAAEYWTNDSHRFYLNSAENFALQIQDTTRAALEEYVIKFEKQVKYFMDTLPRVMGIADSHRLIVWINLCKLRLKLIYEAEDAAHSVNGSPKALAENMVNRIKVMAPLYPMDIKAEHLTTKYLDWLIDTVRAKGLTPICL